MSFSSIGFISAFNEYVTFFQWAKSAISSLHARWSGSQEQSLQDRVLQLESDLQRLSDTLPAMYDLINGAEWRSHEHFVAKLLPSLKDVVSEAEDLLDEFRWYEKKVQVEGDASQSASIGFLDKVIQGNFNKLNNVQLRFTNLSRQLENIGLRGVPQCFDKLVRPETTSMPSETEIFGRDKELEQVLGFLNVTTNSKRKRASSSINASTGVLPRNQVSDESRMLSLPVLPLIGIGGVGKTALAQHICNHQRVKSYFDHIIWICVSDDFDVKRLTKEAIQSCTEKEPTTNNLDSLQHALYNHVNNKRLLIVLDDMWDDALKENGQCWKRFCAPFRSTQEGSAMLVTTRCSKVTEGVRTMEPIKLEGLKDDVFWNFFKSCVFGSESSENYPELEDIGRRILPKLKGSPLAAKTLARMLSMDLQASHWNSLLESELWELKQEKTDILPALRLSYMSLPFYLKQCFSFCAVYPKDYEFHKEQLAEIWVAEGFVEPQRGVPIQHVGFQYFEELVARSFFQEVGGRYVIHDLMHDMAQMVSEHDCFILRNKSDFDKVPQNVRHLYVHPSNDFTDSNLMSLCKYTKLRTLICKKDLGENACSVMDNWCTKLLHMRVICCAYVDELPDSIGNWKHLRYLEISEACPLKRIPSTFCCLYNLQLLYAKKCKLESLPSDFCKLISLQKFESDGLPYYAGSRMYLIDAADGQGQRIVRLVKNLNQLCGHLGIVNVGALSKDHAAEAGLKNKIFLEKLKLDMRNALGSLEIYTQDKDIEVLEVLQPPSSLKSLLLQNYAGAFLPSWFHPQYLPAIKKIRIEKCKMLTSVPTEKFGDLHFLEELSVVHCPNIRLQRLVSPSLKKLILLESGLFCNIDCCSLTGFYLVCQFVKSIQLQMWILPALRELCIKCKSLTSIRGRTRAFSSLSVLSILSCHKLSTLDDLLTQEHLPAIEKIEIEYCPKLLSLPGERFGSFSYLKHLEVYRCVNLNWPRGLVLPSSLQRLLLKRCGDISPYVPSCLENLTSLVSLRMADLGVTSIPGDIWHSNLASLKELVLEDCPHLVSIGGAKAVAKIKMVHILQCPNLEEMEQIDTRFRPRDLTL